MSESDDKKLHWLYRPENRKKLWSLQIVLLVLAVLPEFFVHHHAHFPEQDISIDASFGFFAWYGFGTCALMVVGAKLLGFLLKRGDDYYDR
ncbi:hypothetical protein TDB9533_03054 [Thalassocella blandensis]|nr:hypothetical protein TDB9533_03054 [Thalassocella blandensis]